MELISCFRDTVKLSYTMPVYTSTIEAQNSNQIYKEGFVSDKARIKESGEIVLEAGTLFSVAEKYKNSGRVVVLNCANPVMPGGGIEDGVMGQEECFCRSSNLAVCLNAMNVSDEFYEYHKNNCNFFYSDRVIYTKNITVFKNDDEFPVVMDKEEWFQVDMISCAAPWISKHTHVDIELLRRKVKSRIRNIFEVALDNNAEVVILGAFGCGTFGNSPVMIAEAFKAVIDEQKYEKCFKKIVFALHSYVQESYYKIWQNVFEKFHEHKIGADNIQKEQTDFMRDTRSESPYLKKKISILGDSISTLEGFNPEQYRVHYTGETCIFNNIHKMKDTWWGMVIDYLGAELLINNSYSGSRVTKIPDKDSLFPSGCSDERTKGLHIGNEKPDIIIVFLGTNDWACGVKSENSGTSLIGDENYEVFRFAYETMLYKLKMKYPESEIWCCTLCKTSIKSQPFFVFPDTYGGVSMEVYNEIIRETVPVYDCKLIDLYQYESPYDTLDGSHPTFEGMQALAKMIVKTMIGKDILENGVSRKIWKTENDNLQNNMGNNEFYQAELLETTVLDTELLNSINGNNININTKYPDTIRLKIVSTGEEVCIQKNIFVAGRYKECELRFNSEQKHLMIGRRHATFSYGNNEWYLIDHSSNGTWLNKERMESDKKYLLHRNDVIDFAHTEEVIFFES